MTTGEIAQELGVAPSSTSGRLRRELRRVVGDALAAEPPDDGEREVDPLPGR